MSQGSSLFGLDGPPPGSSWVGLDGGPQLEDAAAESFFDLHSDLPGVAHPAPFVLPGVQRGSLAWCSAMAKRRWGEKQPWKDEYEKLADAYDSFPLRRGDLAQRCSASSSWSHGNTYTVAGVIRQAFAKHWQWQSDTEGAR